MKGSGSRLSVAAGIAVALACLPRLVFVQAADGTAPVVAVATLSPQGPEQYGTGVAGTNTVRGTGNGMWNVNKDGVTVSLSATDNVGVEKFQYAIVTAAGGDGRGGGGGGRGGGRTGDPAGRGAPGGARGGDPAAAAGRAGGAQPASGPTPPCMGTPGAPARGGGGPGGGQPGPAQPPSTFTDLVPSQRGPSATAAIKVTAEGNHTIWYRAVDAAGNPSDPRTIQVAIDTRPPVTTFPAVVNHMVGHSAIIMPEREDPAPGSGGVAIRAAEIDGKFAYPTPLDASQLSLGKHIWTLTAGDAAGNGSRTTLTFVVTTSFADVEALLDRGAKEGSWPSPAASALKAKLAAAKTAADGGNQATAVSALQEFAAEARSSVPAGRHRDLFVSDAAELQRQARGGGGAPSHTGLGVATVVAKGANQHLFVSPFPSSSLAGGNPGARFKVLVMSNCADGFRHESIQTTERVIGQLGKDHGFDVDVYDYVFPKVSVPNPFTSLANLKKYKVIVGVSSVGNNTFAAARLQPDGSVIDEQKMLQDYIHQGGAFVGTHGATDSMHNWEWYKQMIGAEFGGHGGNAAGMQPQCPSCNVAEVITEDGSHPSTQHFAKTFAVRDELYNFRNPPRERVHPLLLLNDATFVNAIGGSPGNQTNNAVPGFGPDHPIAWCQNFEGGRVYANVLLHNWEPSLDSQFQRNLLKGIEWAAGVIPGNCVTHREVKSQIGAALTTGALTAAAAASATTLVESAYMKYLQKNYRAAIADIDALRTLANATGSGEAPARAALLAKAQELKSWMEVLSK